VGNWQTILNPKSLILTKEINKLNFSSVHSVSIGNFFPVETLTSSYRIKFVLFIEIKNLRSRNITNGFPTGLKPKVDSSQLPQQRVEISLVRKKKRSPGV